MHRSLRRFIALTVFLGGSLIACSDDSSGSKVDGPTAIDAGVDAPKLEDLPVNEQVTMASLSAPVDVVVDKRGAPHIYGASIADVLRVQGYLMARDRFPQMEFIRRAVLGKLAEIAGDATLGGVSLLDQDTAAHIAGFGRQGVAIYTSLAAGDETKAAADAFVAGVNQYIDEIKAASDKTPYTPRGAEVLLGALYSSPKFTHWDPSDIFALGRFQSNSLSFDTHDIDFSLALAAVRQAHPDNENDRRSGEFVDLYSMKPARPAFTRDGFGAAAVRTRAATTPKPMMLPALAELEAAQRWASGQKRLVSILGDEFRGSNNWMVHGSHTSSGSPILANDPHLSLTSPPVWWYSHLNTKRAGGDLNVMGVSFAGIPGVVLGFNDDIAWGATITAYDVTDVWQENVVGDTVMVNGQAKPIMPVTETIGVAGKPDATVTVRYLPHKHAYLIPGTNLSVRWTGYEVSNELAYFYGLLRAHNVDEARTAQENFKVGSQNFIVAARDGDISWSTASRVPVRDTAARTLNISPKGVITGHCPVFILQGGAGDQEWTGDVDPKTLPADRNPQKGFIATANNDPVGVTTDGNPCNDQQYLGGRFDLGWREWRIQERLTSLVGGGHVTPADIMGVQAETKSSLGEKLRDPIVQSLSAIIASPGSFADQVAQLRDVHDRLASWSLATPHGIDATDAAEISDSNATAIFNVTLEFLVERAFADEVQEIGRNTQTQQVILPDTEEIGALLERAITDPSQLATFDAAINDTVLWDDVSTTNVTETRNVIVAHAVLDALDFLTKNLGADATKWRWGQLHTVIFETVVPIVGGGDDVLSIPPSTGPLAAGFPRHGDENAVDVSNFSLWATLGQGGLKPSSFRHTSGPSQRLVVELKPTGPEAYNALPGGQAFNPDSPHHADEAQLWIKNEAPRLSFTEADVVKNADKRIRFSSP